MNKKQIKEWVEDSIKKGYDREDIVDLLKSYEEKGEVTKEVSIKILEEYDDKFAEVEKTKISFFERRKLKKGIKKVRSIVEKGAEEIQKLTKHTKALNKKEKKKLDDLKEQMIEAIVGNVEKNKTGLNNIFDIDDEKTGKPIDRPTLESYTLEEIEELLTDLLDALEKEI